MDYAPLQPVRYWVDECQISATPDYEAPSSPALLPNVSIGVEVGEGTAPDGRDVYRCRLTVELGPSPSKQPLPYAARVVVTGFYSAVHEVEIPRDEMSRLVRFNGVAMLYGFARDVIIHQTSLGPHGPLMLPAVNLTEIATRLQASGGGKDSVDETEPTEMPKRRTQAKRRTPSKPV